VLWISALLVLALAVVGTATELASFTPYPVTEIAAAREDFAYALAIALAASLPLVVRRRPAQ
jgi:hypothetical protein